MSAKNQKKPSRAPSRPLEGTVFLRQFQDTVQRFACQQKKRAANTALSIGREVINRDCTTTRYTKNIPNFKNNVKGDIETNIYSVISTQIRDQFAI